MFLILDQQRTEFSTRLKRVAKGKGLKTLLLTSAEIVKESVLVFYMSDQDATIKLDYRNDTIETGDIEGVYCGINTFEPGLWERFTPEDAKYAAQETQALWLAILSSLPCRVLNPPALDTLAGTLLSTPEMIYLAHQMGFETPMMITLESGERALELLSTGVAAKYTDLGDVWIADRFFSSDHTATLQKNGDHFRVKEEAPGKPVFVTLVGDQFFVCTNYRHDHPISMAVNDLPAVIKARIKNLQERLNLVLAEYSFRITENGRWYFCGYGRPPVCSIQAFGDTLLEAVVDYATKKGETE